MAPQAAVLVQEGREGTRAWASMASAGALRLCLSVCSMGAG